MKRLFFCCAILLGVMNSCATKPKEKCKAITITSSSTFITQDFKIKGFNGLQIDIPGKIEYTQGNHYSVSITAPSAVFDAMEVSNKNGILHIKEKSGIRIQNIKDSKKATIRITSPQLDIINLCGVNSFHATSMKGTDTKFTLSGVVNIKIDKIKASKFTLINSGVSRGSVNIDATNEEIHHNTGNLFACYPPYQSAK